MIGIDTQHRVTRAANGQWIALYRGAEIGTADTQRAAQIIAAEDAIEGETDLPYDVAANAGQMFGNVKHMRWFIAAVADEIPVQ